MLTSRLTTTISTQRMKSVQLIHTALELCERRNRLAPGGDVTEACRKTKHSCCFSKVTRSFSLSNNTGACVSTPAYEGGALHRQGRAAKYFYQWQRRTTRWRPVAVQSDLASERNAEATDSRRAAGRSGRDTAEQTPISSYCIAAVAKTMAVSHE